MERVNPTHATCAKELDSDTVETPVHAVPAAEFAMVIGMYASAFKSHELLEEHIAFGPPQ